jgi:hypothetical protein
LRLISFICANLCASIALAPSDSQAATTTGTIFLRGVAPERAVVGMSSPIMNKGTGGAVVPGAPSRTAIELGPAAQSLSAAVFHLTRLANSSSGFVITLSAVSAAGGVLTMTGDDGSVLPYRVRFGGRDIAFSNGEADLATVTRETQDDEASGLFEIIAPAIPAAGNGFSDHIVLVVAAR